MTYDEALSYIHSKERFGSKPGLSRIRRLCALTGNPQDAARFVHVAGTNGKGSVTALLASVLCRAGYRTGRYISPYVECFNERIAVDGRYIADDELASAVESVRVHAERMAAEGDSPTEFEIITAAAFLHFKRSGCQVVALETGLGGRLDATNVIPAPLCAVLTHIACDHTSVLGSKLFDIAKEKCGILKAGSAAVCYPSQEPEVLSVIRERAAEKGIPLRMADAGALSDVECTLSGSSFRYKGAAYSLRLLGYHQCLNAITALEAVGALRSRGLVIPDEAVRAGLSETFFPARLELFGGSPAVLLDGAHNPDGIDALCRAMDSLVAKRRLAAVMGMLRDKDYAYCAEKIARRSSAFFAVEPDNPRALPSQALADLASRFCPQARPYGLNYAGAVAAAKKAAGRSGAVIICGSLYMAPGMRALLRAPLPTPALRPPTSDL